MPGEPARDEQTEKEHLYAQYGRAMLGFQVVEAGLVRCAIPALPEPDEHATVAESWQAVDDLYRKTMGHVKTKIERNVPGVPPELAELLDWGLKVRNYLAHHFLRDRLHRFADAEGRDYVLHELDAIIERMNELRVAVRDFAEHLMREAGVDPAPGHELARELAEERVGFQDIREVFPRLVQDFLDSQRKPD